MNLNILITLLFLGLESLLTGQDTTFVLSTKMGDGSGNLLLPSTDNWLFIEGSSWDWADPKLNVRDWNKLNSNEISSLKVDENNMLESWFRTKIKLDSTFKDRPVYLYQTNSAATDIYNKVTRRNISNR